MDVTSGRIEGGSSGNGSSFTSKTSSSDDKSVTGLPLTVREKSSPFSTEIYPTTPSIKDSALFPPEERA